MGVTGFLYFASMGMYMRKCFRINGDPLKFGLFAALAVPASYGYAKFMMDSAENEAAVLNNAQEWALNASLKAEWEDHLKRKFFMLFKFGLNYDLISRTLFMIFLSSQVSK